ncbi:MAG: excinuclease ABC subunit UvrA, partial [Patescibacteria group bacterium]|nr:excinuclease ABC subunit UvrA [Patescibacteria group bacterium]
QMLKKQNNTVIIVEHDEKTILSADYLVDLGPGAGKNGGQIVAQGDLKKLLANPPEESQTIKYLKKEKQIFSPQKRRTNTTEKIKIIGARANNLKNVNTEIPLRKFVCITGLSGSGKSTLLYDVLYDNAIKIRNFQQNKLENVHKIDGLMYIDKIIKIDQSPIGRTPRSNPATYTGIFTPIREFYAQLDSARERGYSASRFSFNVEGGRCEACQGAGSNLIEMHFLPSVTVKCDVCQGKRFDRETLQVKYKGKTISDVLNMTIDEAAKFFANIYQISEKLNVLREVGLGYLQLGQSATTLSGGEAQRIKLGRELTHPLGKRTLYLLDEPTVGLHYQDVEMLLKVLDRLVSKGNSVLVIEHNMHVAKFSDYIIDLGPEGGEKGGRVVAHGTPEEIANSVNSLTGKYLKEYLR